MRIDKWLKMSRIIKRRTIAQMACDQGRVFVNDRPVKPGLTLKVGDRVHVEFGSRALTVDVAVIPTKAPSIQEASSIYTMIEEIRRPPEKLDWLPDGEDFE